MVEISESARDGLTMALQEAGDLVGLRLVVHGDSPALYQVEMHGMTAEEQKPEDTMMEYGELKVFLDQDSLPKAEGLLIDTVQTPQGPRIKVDFPPVKWEDPLEQKVQDLIDERINPNLQSHGGFVALLRVVDGTAELVMGGGCQGCGYSRQTMHEFVEVIMKEEIPEIKAVVDKTDHAMAQRN